MSEFKGAWIIAGAFVLGAMVIAISNSKKSEVEIDAQIDRRLATRPNDEKPFQGDGKAELDAAIKDFGDAVDALKKTNEKLAADNKRRAEMKTYMEGVESGAIPPPPVALQIAEPKKPQCNPVFTRGDIVRHRGMPEQHYVVVTMDVKDCTAFIRHPDLHGQSTFTDLLELEPKT